ncbi:archease [Candidatus Woesearchaeota archaeon]|nr:archease [Candidatus Woesearchaeota archaeon]
MKRFEYFEHTADTLFRAYGKDFEEALGNVILAVYNVIVDTEQVRAEVERSFTVKAGKQEALVYDLVEELLYLLDTEGFLCHNVKRCSFSGRPGAWKAGVVLVGDVRAERYDVSGQVKAPTYNQMLIGEWDGKVFIQAVLDL